MAKKVEETFYIGIGKPKETRRTLLEAVKLTIQLLQRYQHFIKLKDEKTEKVEKLKSIMAELQEMTAKLKAALPKTKTNNLPQQLKKLLQKKPKEPEEKSKKKKVIVDMPKVEEKHEEVKPEPKVPKSELERLEEELSHIEGKLGDI